MKKDKKRAGKPAIYDIVLGELYLELMFAGFGADNRRKKRRKAGK